MPAAMRRGRTATLRAASAGLDGSEASPLVLFQQPAELSVLRPQGSLGIAHTVMIADPPGARQAPGSIPAPEGERQAGTVQDQLIPRLTGRYPERTVTAASAAYIEPVIHSPAV